MYPYLRRYAFAKAGLSELSARDGLVVAVATTKAMIASARNVRDAPPVIPHVAIVVVVVVVAIAANSDD